MSSNDKKEEQWQLYQQIGRILSSSNQEMDGSEERITPEAECAIVF